MAWLSAPAMCLGRDGWRQHRGAFSLTEMMVFVFQGDPGPQGFPGTPGDMGPKGEKVRVSAVWVSVRVRYALKP